MNGTVLSVLVNVMAVTAALMPAGGVTVIVPATSSTTADTGSSAPTFTTVELVKLRPVKTTGWGSLTRFQFWETAVTIGVGWYANLMELLDAATVVPSVVLTTTGAARSVPAGTLTTTSLSLTATSFVTRSPPTVTPSKRSSTPAVPGSSTKPSTPVNPAPRIDATEPPIPLPDTGVTAVTIGPM